MSIHNLSDIVNAAARPDHRLTPDQADFLVRGVVSAIRAVLAADIRGWHPDRPEEKLLDHDALAGYCGFAQCVVAYALDDMGIRNQPFATQALACFQYQGHVALVIPLQTTDGKKYYLIDPTYIQFRDEYDTGNQTVSTLMRDGYIALDPQVANDYIKSLCDGRGFPTPEQAFLYMKHPEPNKNNHWFRYDEVGARVSSFKDYLASQQATLFLK